MATNKAQELLSLAESSRAVDPNAIRRATANLKTAVRHKMGTVKEQEVGGKLVLIGDVDGQPMKVTIEPSYKK